MKNLIIFLCLCWCYPVFSQGKFTLSGTIKDAKTGETLIGSSIRIKDNPAVGTVTNEYGFYSLTLPSGRYLLLVQNIGFRPKTIDVDLSQSRQLNIELSDSALRLEEVTISSEKADRNVSSTEMSTVKVDIREANKVPVLFGERDIMKTLQLLPGIKSAGEGNTGFYVRGGGIDQNLILLDEATVYNASHLLGFFSVFNSDAIKDVTIYKGGMPAEYGGRISSVLDVRMNDGNAKKFGVSGGIGLIASRLTIEGPIVKDKGSFIISGRRTYADLFLKLSSDSTLKKSRLYFYDLNLKANYQLGKRDKLFLSGYFGLDDFGLGTTFGFSWGNTTGTLRWNHIFNDKLFLNSSLIYSDYSYKIALGSGNNEFDIISAIRDYSLKEDFHYYISPNNTLKFGLQSTYHTFVPGEITSASAASLTLQRSYAVENAAYISDEFDVTHQLKINAGLRYSTFSLLGPSDIYTYDKDGAITNTTTYTKNQVVKNYGGAEPRAAATYIINDVSSIKASYSWNLQYLHLLSNSVSTSPTDLWVPSSNNIKPQKGDQKAIGYYRNFDNNHYEASAEIYYRNFYDQIDYRTGADLRFNKFVESQLVYGNGRAYGIEFFLKKKFGKFNGWAGYTLSKTDRTFADIDNGTAFSARQDRTHDLSLVGIYELNPKWTFAATFVYHTGNAVTFPSGKYYVDGKLLDYFTERNGYRMPAYHRLDISATWQRKKTAKFESSWNFSVYNVYAQENAYSISFQKDPNDPNKTQAIQTSLFRAIPSFTYNFKF
jgi:hypothetical protein